MSRFIAYFGPGLRFEMGLFNFSVIEFTVVLKFIAIKQILQKVYAVNLIIAINLIIAMRSL